MADAVASTSALEPPPPVERFSFPRAAQPEIVRAYQKDTYYRDLLTSHLNDVVRGLLGTRTLHTHMDTIALLGSLVYFSLTSLGGSGQTLGEEYVNAIMVDSRRGRIVRAKRRTAFILLHVIAPFLLSKLYTSLRRFFARKQSANQQAEQRARMRARALNKPPPSGTQSLYRRMVAMLANRLPAMDTIKAQDGWLAYAGAAHLMLFYLGGRYYGVAQRLAGVQYISAIAQRPGARPPSYEVLGVLLGIQLGVKMLLSANSWRRSCSQAAKEEGEKQQAEESLTVSLDSDSYTHRTSPASFLPPSASGTHPSVPLHYVDASRQPSAAQLRLPPNTDASAAQALSQAKATSLESIAQNLLRCTLCMDNRQPEKGTSAVTECGHIFCWDCIVGWAREKPECPLCRQSIQVNRILPVYNF